MTVAVWVVAITATWIAATLAVLLTFAVRKAERYRAILVDIFDAYGIERDVIDDILDGSRIVRIGTEGTER